MPFCVVAMLLMGCGENPEVEELARQQELQLQGQQLGSILRSSNARVTTEDKSLTIQLTFGADSDLDLYVTDPLLETVYFANHQSRSGGRISRDISCDDLDKHESPGNSSQARTAEQSPEQEFRIEEVRFDSPIPGLYRIGIDYPGKCRDGEDQAAYAVSIRHKGELIQNSGAVVFERFDVVVLEFEI